MAIKPRPKPRYRFQPGRWRGAGSAEKPKQFTANEPQFDYWVPRPEIWINRRAELVWRWWNSHPALVFVGRTIVAVSVIAAVIAFWNDLQDRKVERENQAWSLIAQVATNQCKPRVRRDRIALRERDRARWTRPDDRTDIIGEIGVGSAIEVLYAQGVDMSRIRLRCTSLSRMNISSRWTRGGRRAQLNFSDFRESNIADADFTGAEISNAKFSFAEGRNANFSRTKALGAKFIEVLLPFVNFFASDIPHADFSFAELPNSSFRRANLAFVDFREAELHNADLRGAVFAGTKFIDADLRGAVFTNAVLSHEKFVAPAFFLRVDVSGADLRRAIGLTPEMIDQACGNDETKLPPGLPRPKPCE